MTFLNRLNPFPRIFSLSGAATQLNAFFEFQQSALISVNPWFKMVLNCVDQCKLAKISGSNSLSLTLPLSWRLIPGFSLFFLCITLAVNPAFAQTNPAATSQRFLRGTGTDADYHSFVIPLGTQKGIALNPTGSQPQSITGSALWWYNSLPSTLTINYSHYNATTPASPIAFNNPVAAFGASVGATPLYIGQPYQFGVSAGTRATNWTQSFIQIQVYSAKNLETGPVGTIDITIPQKGTTEWDDFVANGSQKFVDSFGLVTLVSLAESSDPKSRFDTTKANPYIITHVASSADYYYRVDLRGSVKPSGSTTYQPMATKPPSDEAYEPLYTLDFSATNPWSSVYLQMPQFQGKPLPSQYNGKSKEELTQTPFTLPAGVVYPNLGNTTTYTQITSVNNAPEVTAHPQLDAFINTMKSGDPKTDLFTFTNYVLNEIKLTDFIGYNEDGSVSEQSINPGGLSRGAYATYMEGAGSPTEQCALLVYCLRKAGIPAVYVKPVHNQLKMLDFRLSQLFHTQIKGVVNTAAPGAPQEISVNYPWVTAYVDGQWRQLFPWYKDTQVTEGRSIYDVFPPQETVLSWIKKFLNNDPTIITDIPSQNTPLLLFPKYLLDVSKATHPDISLDQLGITFTDRKHYFSNFEDLPAPFRIDAGSSGVTLPQVINDLSSYPNLYNTARITITRGTTTLFDSGDWKLLDLHNRRFVIRHEKTGTNTHNMFVTMAPFDFADTTPNGLFSDQTNVTQQKQAIVALGTDDSEMRVNVELHYQRNFDMTNFANAPTGFLNLIQLRKVTANSGFKKGDLLSVVVNPGIASEKMLQMHVDQYSLTQRKVDQDATYIPGDDLYQGLSSYLMGQQYFAKMGLYSNALGGLFKISPVAVQTIGFSKILAERQSGVLPNSGDVKYSSPSMDMYFHLASCIYSGDSHPDRPGISLQSQKDYSALLIVGGSMEEQLTGNRYLNSSSGLSTIGLLQKAAKEKPGGTGIITLTKNNYIAEGNKIYGTKALKDHDPAIWSLVNQSFLGSATDQIETDYNVAYITPGAISLGTNLPSLVGALVLNNLNADYYRQNGMIALLTGVNSSSPQNGYELSYDRNIAVAGGQPYSGGTSSGYDNYSIGSSSGSYGGGSFGGYYGGGWGSFFSSYERSRMIRSRYTNSSSVGSSSGGATGSNIFVATLTAPQLISTTDFISSNYTAGFSNSQITYSAQQNSFTQVLKTIFDPTVSTYSGALKRQADQGSLFMTPKNSRIPYANATPNSEMSTHNQESSVGRKILDPVDVINGEFYVHTVDLELQGAFPLQISRNYSSLNIADNQFGYGWKFGYMHYLTISDDTLIINAAEPSGTVMAYRKKDGVNEWYPEIKDNPKYTNLSESLIGSVGNLLNNKIIKTTQTNPNDAANPFEIYTLTGSDGSTRVFKVQSYPLGTAVDLDRKRPYLQTWSDHKGNQYTFTYGTDVNRVDYGELIKIVSSNGTFIGFTYDEYRHIIEAFASDSRRVYYSYSSDGDLISVTLPDASVVAYDYKQELVTLGSAPVFASNHLIIRETKPDNRILENDYDDQRRVIRQRAVVGINKSPIRNATFDYQPTYTIVKDAYDRMSRYDIANGLLTKISDANGNEETTEWYSDVKADAVAAGGYPLSVKKTTDKRGLVTEYLYDALGNVTQKTVTGNLKGDGVSTTTEVTKTTYNTLNLPVTQLDGLNHYSKYTYDTTYPYLVSKIEIKIMQGASIADTDPVISKETFTYENVTEGTRTSKGILKEKISGLTTAEQIRALYVNTGLGYPSQCTHFGGTSPDVIEEFSYDLQGQMIELRLKEGSGYRVKKNFSYDNMGRRIWEETHDGTSGALLAWNYVYYNLNGEVEWTDGPKWGPEDYTWKKYDGAGRLAETHLWRSRAKADGTGVEALPDNELYSSVFNKYDLFGNLTEAHDSRGNSITMEYDSIGQMTKRRSYEGDSKGTLLSEETFTYEPGGQVTEYKNPLGAKTTKTYNTLGLLQSQTNPDGSQVTYLYDISGRLLQENLPNGTSAVTTYDDLNRTVTRKLMKGSTELSKSTKIMSSLGQVLTEKDAFDNLFTTTYDGLGRVKSKTGPATTASATQQTTTITYDAAGRLTQELNGLSEKTETIKDALDRPLTVTVYSSTGTAVRKTAYAYSTDHQSVTITEGTGMNAISTTSYTDNFGNPILTKFADNKFKRQVYDIGGKLIESYDELSRMTSMTYDGKGRLLSQTLPDGAKTTYVYNAADEVLQRLMPGNTSEKNTYDNLGRLTKTEWLGGSQSTKSYSYSYYASGPFIGLLNTATDARGVVFTTTYDDYLRKYQVTSAGSLPEQNQQTTFIYDKRGLPTNIAQAYVPASTGASTEIQRSYDAYGQASQEKVLLSGALISQFDMTRDAAARRKTLNFGLAAQGTTTSILTRTFNYQADGNMTSLVIGGKTYSDTYADNGLLSTRTSSYRTLTVNNRDTRGRMKLQTTKVGTTNVLTETLDWNDDSTVKTYAPARAGGTTPYNESRAYFYNNRNQLTSESFVPGSGLASKIETYEFDLNTPGGLGVLTKAQVNGGATGEFKNEIALIDAWMRSTAEGSGGKSVQVQGTAKGAASVSVALNSQTLNGVNYSGQQGSGDWNITIPMLPGNNTVIATATHPTGKSTVNTTSNFNVTGTFAGTKLVYDAAGNITQRTYSNKTQNLTWDGQGRLVKVTERDTANTGYDWNAVYDALGRRIQVKYNPVTANVAGTVNTTKSFFDPEVEFLELGIEVAGQRYWKVIGPDLTGDYGSLNGIGGIEAVIRESSNQISGAVNDFYGNVVASSTTTAVTWNTVKITGYGPLSGSDPTRFEKLTTAPAAATVATAYLWRSRAQDATSFFNLGARHYDAVSARFLSPDPMSFGSDMTLYSYANGDPVNGVDADGRLAAKGAMLSLMHVTGSIYNEVNRVNQFTSDYEQWGGGATGAFAAVNRYNLAKSIHDFASGNDLIDGHRLSTFERTMSGIGAATFVGAPLMSLGSNTFASRMPTKIYNYSYQETWKGNTFTPGAAGRAWATKYAPGDWAFKTGIKNTLERIFKTGRVAPFKSSKEITGPAVNSFRPVGPAIGPFRGWKNLAGQYFTKTPGDLNLITGKISNPTSIQLMRYYGEATLSYGLDGATLLTIGGKTYQFVTESDSENETSK